MRRRAGQALVEMAIVAPVLIILLLGAAQVGQIAYSMVSIDTASREGARAGVEAPNSSLTWDAGGAMPATHTCTTAEFTEGSGSTNPICIAVLNADGFLDKNLFTSNPCGTNQACVTIKVLGSGNLARYDARPQMRLAAAWRPEHFTGSGCNPGSSATVNGTVNGIPGGSTATVTDSSNDTPITGVTSTFSMCVSAGGQNAGSTQTLTANVGPGSCGGYSGSVGPFDVAKGNTYAETITVTAEPACPTPPPSPTPTATASPSPTGTPLPTPPPTAPPGTSCPSQVVPDADGAGNSNYISVTVSYPVSIFVPIAGAIFQTSPGYRLVTTTATFAIEPCTLTQGA